MSMRIHKHIGYGIKNLKTRNGIPSDPRWDYKKYLLKWRTPQGDSDPDKEQTLQQFYDWCHDNRGRILGLANREYGLKDPSMKYFLMMMDIKDKLLPNETVWLNPFDWQPEFGYPGVLLFTPPENYHEWRRYNNSIDYYEERGTQKRVQFIKANEGLHPYDGSIKRVRMPSEKVSIQIEGLSSLIRTCAIVQDRNKCAIDIDVIDANSYDFLLSSIAPLIGGAEIIRHFKEDWRPRIPLSILAMIEFMGCFPDPQGPKGILADLRPMLYVWWS